MLKNKWHAVANKRVTVGKANISRDGFAEELAIFALVLEPLRWLTGWYLYFGSSSRRRAFRAPPLCTWTNEARSPVTRVLQYFSKLLAGRTSRLILLYKTGGYDTFEAWCRGRPQLLAMFRIGIVTASTWIFRRFGIKSWPWRLAQVVDPRLSIEERQEIADEFMRFPPYERLDNYFSLRLRRLLAERPERNLLSPFWQSVMLLWAWSVLFSIAVVEFLHGRNRNRSRRDTCWTTFVANYLLQESKIQFDTLSEAQPLPPEAAAGDKCQVVKKEKRTRKKTGLDIFSSEYGELQRALGRSFNWVREQRECKEKYDALPPPRRDLFERRAELSLSAADARARR